jgi:uncharacterized protein YcbX
MPVLKQIFVYPIKSLAGFSVQHWEVGSKGLMYDRQWMLIDSQHQFLSQRRLPRMALIKTRIEQSQLILSAPDQQDFAIPLQAEVGETLEVTIWDDHCEARTVSSAVDHWFSQFLETECRLVYHPEHSTRQVDQRYAQPQDQTAFSDGFPFLIVSQGSLDALNQAMQLEMSMSRFRPNLVISECDAYAEDSWRRIQIGKIGLRLPKPCSRCSVPTIDPETGIIGKEPLTTLNRLRKHDNKVYFGQNAIHDHLGTLSVGDALEILETGPNQP